MPEYLHPDVYVEEVSSGVRPIEGVSTSTAGFIGETVKGRPNQALLVTSWTEFVRRFGGMAPDKLLPYAVSSFFANGGKRCYIVRALNQASAKQSSRMLADRETDGTARQALRITAKGAGKWGDSVDVLVEDGTALPRAEFKLTVRNAGEVVEVFDNLTMDPSGLAYVETEINGASEYMEVKDLEAVDAARNSKNTGGPEVPTNAYAITTSQAAARTFPGATGEDLIISVDGGPPQTATLTGSNVPRDTVVQTLNTQFAPLGVAASVKSSGEIVITHNTPGREHYLTVSGAAATGGLAGLNTSRLAESGPAVGAFMKSKLATGGKFNVGNAATALTVTIDSTAPGDEPTALSITIPAGNASGERSIDDVVNDIQAGLGPAATALANARREGDRIVITTTAQGQKARLDIAGAANTSLAFKTAAGGAGPVTGLGRSEPAFALSGRGPFALAAGSTLTFKANNKAGGVAVPVTLTFNPSAAMPNLQAVTAAQLAQAINTAAAGATPATPISASVIDGRVRVSQSIPGNAATLEVTDGVNSPNVALGFEASPSTGYAEGDGANPYYRPAMNIVANKNEGWLLTGGDDGLAVSEADFKGSPAAGTGLYALDKVDDVSFVAIPGGSTGGLIGDAVGYCEMRGDCVFIADAPGVRRKGDPVIEPAKARDFARNQISHKSSYGALYYPWIEIADPVGAGRNPKRHVPPSGFVAGLYARTDVRRGVWKAPAGTEAGLIGALGLEYVTSGAEQDTLNPIGVNCLRNFSSAGMVIWGARTLGTQSDPEWRYLPVRRYAIYLRQSILRGTQWAVFEPNDFPLWGSLQANITDFMMGEFRRGALAGETPAKAFLVKCDEDLNPPSEVQAGRVNMEVKFAPLRPAEFVVIKISQKVQTPES